MIRDNTLKDKTEKQVVISVTISPYDLDYLDEVADRQSRNRSNMLTVMLRYYRDAAERSAP